jgi:hypothetical protein
VAFLRKVLWSYNRSFTTQQLEQASTKMQSTAKLLQVCSPSQAQQESAASRAELSVCNTGDTIKIWRSTRTRSVRISDGTLEPCDANESVRQTAQAAAAPCVRRHLCNCISGRWLPPLQSHRTCSRHEASSCLLSLAAARHVMDEQGITSNQDKTSQAMV